MFESESRFRSFSSSYSQECTAREDIGFVELLQSPDLSLSELLALLRSNKYSIHSGFLKDHFLKSLYDLNQIGTDSLLDVINNLNQLINSTENDTISRISVAGYFCRRLLLSLNKLSFSELTSFVYEFMKYYVQYNEAFQIGSFKMKANDWYKNKNQWTRRQAELFIATQATMLTNNEEKAINPPELHKHIHDILKSNSDLAEAVS